MARPKKSKEDEPAIEGADTNDLSGLINYINDRAEGVAIRRGCDVADRLYIPTGRFMIDFASMGGIVDGGITMLRGTEDCGKTSTVYTIIAEYQKKHPDKTVFFVDAESTYDPAWAEKLGVDLSRMYALTLKTIEEIADVLVVSTGHQAVGMIVIDSIAGISTKEVIEKSAEDVTVSPEARIWTKFCQRIVSARLRESNKGHYVTMLMTNQRRTKLGSFIPGESFPGGAYINNHIPILTLLMRNINSSEKDGGYKQGVIGNQKAYDLIKVRLKKDKQSPSSLKEVTLTIGYEPERFYGLPVGQCYEVDDVWNMMKRFGLVYGGGGKYRIRLIDDPDVIFKKHEEIKEYIGANPKVLEFCKVNLLALERIRNGFKPLPPDNYLCCDQSKERLVLPEDKLRTILAEGLKCADFAPTITDADLPEEIQA